MGNVEAVIDFIFSKIIADVDCSHEVKRCLPLGRKAMTHRQCIKKHRDHSANKGPYSQSYDFSSGHVGIWELDHKEGWGLKNWCFWSMVLKKTLESPLGCKIKPVNPKGNQLWIFIGRTDAELQYFGHLMWRVDSVKRVWCWERLKAKGEGDGRGMRWLDSVTDSMEMNLSKFRETEEDRGAWYATVHGVAKSQIWVNDWTTAT